MLELRLTADAKRMAALRSAIADECRRAKADPEHAATVALVAERLIVSDPEAPKRARRSDVFVIVTVQSDATMLMVRVAKPARAELDESRLGLLDTNTTRWSTMSGADGRTIWAEIPRAALAPLVLPDTERPATPTPQPAPAPKPAPTVHAGPPARSVRIPAFASGE